jgi:glycerol kinase
VNAAATAIHWAQRRLHDATPIARLDRRLGPQPGAAPRLFFLPAVAGLGAPHWNPAARPRFAPAPGVRPATLGTRERLRAVVVSIAHRCAEIARTADRHGVRDNGGAVMAAGGLTRCRTLLQAQADLLRRAVVVGTSPDATALGAVRLALHGVGGHPGPPRREARHRGAGGGVPAARIVRPRCGRAVAAARQRNWERAVYGAGRSGRPGVAGVAGPAPATGVAPPARRRGRSR